ncbi:hypothetical protein MPTK1_7g06570 [Marchantia polymorpha subsp. ruderalis]|nr:hypothetical protein MARPO_0057s0010 [Marchantia polymorpha]PTQ37368.1 hypothetical protein MARPO_0057s0010 [Marchantia polymorpha]BBN16469.1 hypothetical protein Mp_7g06570 [Marchantia polymorpha subsp. ruderalis]BBN16470.1 hypothetical protein Mp_7g06570 [Marchantia polymorpha subsp. ruderalis]|eukprot:PTQ37367.1 hypothetical protein MARPO_0057s0010 [Marchantia polymorpha]
MQGSQGRAGAGGGSGSGSGSGGGSGSGRHGGYPGRANGVANNNLGAGAGLAYGGMPGGYVFNNWVGYGNYQMPSLMPMPPVVPRSYGRGSASHSFVPLGVQGAGILKRPSGPPQGQSMHGRSNRNRGHNGRSWGSRDRDRDRKNLTKEALDADLDEYRMKDKKFGGQSLDAELDEYWKKKEDSDLLPEEDELKDSGEGGADIGAKDGKVPAGGTTSSRHSHGDKQSADGSKSKSPSKDA